MSDTTLPRKAIARKLAELEYGPGEFVRDDESLWDFAGRLVDAGFAIEAAASEAERARIRADARLLAEAILGGSSYKPHREAAERVLAAIDATHDRADPAKDGEKG